MSPPNLVSQQVQSIVPNASDIQLLDQCGQKIVFSAFIDGQKYALKFLSPNPSRITDASVEFLDDVTARAKREVETMQQCSTPHMVRMGPIGLQTAQVNGEPVIYFSEEFIEGKNLKKYLQENGNLSISELILLSFNISEAIKAIWQCSKIHRDIKPSNIIRRESNGEFVLLDMGLVFDLQDDSLSICPVGTRTYFSPEQTDFNNRRTVMNFRSDLFSLGIVVYEMATGKHPFITPISTTSWDVFGNIINMTPEPPINHRPELPQKLDEIILRLLAKRPALRYKSIDMFQQALNEVESEGGNS